MSPKSKNNILLPLSLFLLTIITRVPFTSKLLYHMDSVHFALALEKYDITVHQPHPPGYFLYVMLGRLLNFFIKDANITFVSISVIFSGLTVVAVYYLGKELYDKRTGFFAAVIAMTSPNLWFHGEVALTYIVEAFFSTVIAFLCWKIYKGEHPHPIPPPSRGRGQREVSTPSSQITPSPCGMNPKTSPHSPCESISEPPPSPCGRGQGGGVDKYIWLSVVAMGIVGGIRQNTIVFLFPLWLFSVKEVPPKKIIAALGLLGITCLSWFIPMVYMTGGWNAYHEAFRELWLFNTGHVSVFEKGWASLKIFSSSLFDFTIYGVGAGILILGLAAYSLIRRKKAKSIDRTKAFFFPLWVLPSVFFYLLIFIHPANPGYVLIFLPALFILVAASIEYISAELKQLLKKDIFIPMALAIIIINTCIFFFSKYPVSYLEVKTHDKDLSIMLEGIKTFDLSRTAVFVGPYIFYGYRHIMYYLPEYRVYQVDVRIIPTGEIRKTFWGVNRETFLSDDINLPENIDDFLIILISDNRNKVAGIEKLSIKNLQSTNISIASGHISLVKNVYPELRVRLWNSEIN